MPPIRSVDSTAALKSLHDGIDKIPGAEGWWKGGGTYHRLGEFLFLRVGMTEAEVIDTLAGSGTL